MSKLKKQLKKEKKVRLLPQNILRVTESRIPKNKRHPDLYYYGMRHGELDWDTPITIEDFVAVNFYGTLVTCVPLELTDNQPGESAYLKLKPKEREYLRERAAGKLRSKSNAKD